MYSFPPLWQITATLGSFTLYHAIGPADVLFKSLGEVLDRIDRGNDPAVLSEWHREVRVEVRPQ